MAKEFVRHPVRPITGGIASSAGEAQIPHRVQNGSSFNSLFGPIDSNHNVLSRIMAMRIMAIIRFGDYARRNSLCAGRLHRKAQNRVIWALHLSLTQPVDRAGIRHSHAIVQVLQAWGCHYISRRKMRMTVYLTAEITFLLKGWVITFQFSIRTTWSVIALPLSNSPWLCSHFTARLSRFEYHTTTIAVLGWYAHHEIRGFIDTYSRWQKG